MSDGANSAKERIKLVVLQRALDINESLVQFFHQVGPQ